jgi:hypothetical protein
MALTSSRDKHQTMVTGQSPGPNLPTISQVELCTIAPTTCWDGYYEQALTKSRDKYAEHDLTAGSPGPILQTGAKAPTSYQDKLQDDGTNPRPKQYTPT